MQKYVGNGDDSKPLQGLKVLVAEDDALAAQLIQQVLSDAGANVVGPYRRVADARAQLHQSGADFILIDLGLQDDFADELAADARELKIPFAILTGYLALPTNAADGAVAVISKPVPTNLLIDTLAPFA